MLSSPGLTLYFWSAVKSLRTDAFCEIEFTRMATSTPTNPIPTVKPKRFKKVAKSPV